MNSEAKSLQTWGEDPGWRGKVGFISPPSLDITPMEFVRVAPRGFAVIQTLTHVPNFKVEAEYIAKAVAQIEGCAMSLKDAGVDLIAQVGTPFSVDLIAQVGTPFSFVAEGGLGATRDLHARIEGATGIPLSMQGLAIADALKAMGHSSVAVACTYYNDDLAQRYARFLEGAGVRVLAMQNWVSQGIYATQHEVEAARGWYPWSHTYRAARLVAARAPTADCIIVSGGGVRTMDLLDPLERDLSLPVISSDAAQFWDILVRLGVREPITGRGSLLAGV